jgi:hypothetical protein
MILIVGQAFVHLRLGEHRRQVAAMLSTLSPFWRRPMTSCTAIRVPSTRALPPRTSGERTMYR